MSKRQCEKCQSTEITLVLNTKDFLPGRYGPKELDLVCDNCGFGWTEPSTLNMQMDETRQ